MADITLRHINIKEFNKGSIGHFGFFKEKMKDTLWQQTLEWIYSKC